MMSPAGFEHGVVAGRIYGHLFNFVEKTHLGLVMAAETGFLIERNPDTVRAPDVAWIRADRVPTTRIRGFFPGAPDLAVEVVSPDDRAVEVLAKTRHWLAAGCRAVWVADPDRQTVMIYRGDSEPVSFALPEELICDDVLPGFRLPLASVF
jgi:Uma2 family endonuclease